MSESEIEGFLNKVESGLVEAQHDMLVEKALYRDWETIGRAHV